jgi:Tfp pilus assembly protein PilN
MLNQFFRINIAIGIGLTIHSDGFLSIAACKIVKQNNQLDFEEKLTGLKSLEELSKRLPHQAPVSLNISGKGILYKQVEKMEEITPLNFSQLLPNAHFEDFYIQNFRSGERSFVAVIRKTEADKWLAEFKNLGLNVVMLSLGPYPAYHILPQLNFYDEEVIFDGHLIQRDEQKHWVNYRYERSARSPFSLKIESEKIDEQLVIAYASAFQLVMAAQLEPVPAGVQELESAYQKALSVKWIKAYGAIVLFLVFLLLIINFIAFSWIENDNVKAAYQVSRSAQSTNDIKGIAEQIKQKEQKLSILGWDGGLNKAYLIDQLASNLPEQITWKEIAVNPIDLSQSRVQKTLSFKDRQIRVTGFSEQIIPVNEWMARIKIKNWVKGVQLESYNFNPELNTGQFTLVIAY